MKLYKILLAAFALIMLATACDEITGDFEEKPTTEVDTTKAVQKFLLEDYTGYTCGNCPRAHEEARKIHELYPNQVIVLGVHSGSFAEPYAPHPYDFRTLAGTTFDEFFGNSAAGNPNGMINRMKFNDSYIVRHTKWATLIASMINDEPLLKMKLETDYSDSDRKISVKVDMDFLKATDENFHICVVISEDSIIQYQKDYDLKENQDILDYKHDHVLRASITDPWGLHVSEVPITLNQRITKNYTYTIPSGKDWKIDDLNIIAFVYSHSSDYKIVQAESKKLK